MRSALSFHSPYPRSCLDTSLGYLESAPLILLHLRISFYAHLRKSRICLICFALLILFFQSSLYTQLYSSCIHFHFPIFFILIPFEVSCAHCHHQALSFCTNSFTYFDKLKFLSSASMKLLTSSSIFWLPVASNIFLNAS